MLLLTRIHNSILMAVYKFRVTFEDYDDVSRDIEIKATQTFEDLHYAIHSYIGFDASKPASFFLSDDNWKKGKEISNRDLKGEEKGTVIPFRNSRLCDTISDPHQKIFYLFDPAEKWAFHIELIKIITGEDYHTTYPRCVKTVGEAPKQYPPAPTAAIPVPEDFDETAAEMELEESEPEIETEVETGVDEEDIPVGVEEVEPAAEELDAEPGEIMDEETTDEDET